MRAPEVISQYADGPAGPKLLEVEPDGVARALVASAGRHADPVRAIAAARTLRRRELARVASADLLGMLEVVDVCKALTSVWVAVLQAALEAVIRANTPSDGGAPARIAVIGMGRLGGGELGYGSDADVMFVCDPNPGFDESGAVRWSITVAEQVRSLLGTPSADPPLEVDAGLRPEGRRRSAESRLASTRSGCPAEQTPTRTPNSAVADWPTSSGRFSCCNSGMGTRFRRCTTPRLCMRW